MVFGQNLKILTFPKSDTNGCSPHAGLVKKAEGRAEFIADKYLAMRYTQPDVKEQILQDSECTRSHKPHPSLQGVWLVGRWVKCMYLTPVYPLLVARATSKI